MATTEPRWYVHTSPSRVGVPGTSPYQVIDREIGCSWADYPTIEQAQDEVDQRNAGLHPSQWPIAKPTKATHLGHGRPGEFLFFGCDPKGPESAHRRVTAQVGEAGAIILTTVGFTDPHPPIRAGAPLWISPLPTCPVTTPTVTEKAPEPAQDATTPIVIVPCGGKKLDHPAPAGELYTGSYHAAARRAATATAPGARVLILSAKHGLLDLEQVIAPYELHMAAPGAITTDQLADQAHALGVAQAAEVTVIAGRAYANAVTAVWPHATRPLDGCRGMGEQLARMVAMTRPAAPTGTNGQLALFA